MKPAIVAMFCALAAAAIATPSSADPWDQWLKKTTDKGCYLFDYGTTYGGHAESPDIEGFIWSGPCVRGQPINGEGTLYEQYKTDYLVVVRSYRGRVVNGYFDGPVQYREHAVAADGSWDPEVGVVPEGGEDPTYERGCGWIRYNCTPGQASDVVLLRAVSPPYFPLPDADSTETAAGPLGLRNAQLQPPAATGAPAAASGGDGDVWDTCVTTEAPVESGIQMIYAFRNICGKTVTIAFCMKATYEAAGDWNLCSQRGYKTYDIRAGARFEFPFTPVTPGSAMSDGRVVDHNEVSASGHACIGSSPSVYVENKRLVFQHC